MQARVGTSGFSYKEWKGSFYPEKLPAKDMLGYYAEQLSTVEINNTFYRMPKASVLEGWALKVPEDFRFSIKASRRITHNKRLVEVEDDTAYLLSQLEALGRHLGVVLFQLPPHLKADLDRLSRFLDLLPVQLRCAFEFRHPSWLEADTAALLYGRGATVCIADSDTEPAQALDSAAPFVYVRLRRSDYSGADLAEWALRLRAVSGSEAFVFFKHEAQGPGFAAELQALVAEAQMASVRPAVAGSARSGDAG